MSKPDYDEGLPPPYTESAVDIREDDPFVHRLHGILAWLQTSPTTNDSTILSTLIDPIRSFLSSVTSIRPQPRVIEATFIPEDALGPEWTLSDPGDRNRGELSRLVRVRGYGSKRKMDSEKKNASTNTESETRSRNREFDDWGRWDEGTDDNGKDTSELALWWSDEELARRLAANLQPDLAHDISTRRASSRVSTTVRADEVAFRRENEMGIWESKSGWAVIVRVGLQA